MSTHINRPGFPWLILLKWQILIRIPSLMHPAFCQTNIEYMRHFTLLASA